MPADTVPDPPPAAPIHTPPKAKQPEVRFTPPLKVEVAWPMIKRLLTEVEAADRLPVKVEVPWFVTKRLVRVEEPALKKLVTPNVVDVAAANVAVFETTSCDVEAVFVIPRKVEVAKVLVSRSVKNPVEVAKVVVAFVAMRLVVVIFAGVKLSVPRFVAKRKVEVACVVVPVTAVKELSVVEPVTSRFAAVRNPRFAVMPSAVSDPPVMVKPLEEARPAV